MGEVPHDKTYKTPWDMPEDIFWDHSEGAELRRARWVLENRSDLSLQDIYKTMPFTTETLRELEYEPFETPFGMPEELFWSTEKESDKHRLEWVKQRLLEKRRETMSHLVLARTIKKN